MDITWLGHACFRLKGRESVIIMDPCPKSTGYNIGKQQAQIVTISHEHPDHAFIEAVTTDPKRIDAPGEYEINGVMITGVRAPSGKKSEPTALKPTSFVVEVDEVRVCHLGGFAEAPTSEQIEALSDIDVLLTPVGGHGALTAAAAAEVISQLEPKIVVPMQFATDAATAELDPIDSFLKQMGISGTTSQSRLSITRANLPVQTQVLVLEYRK